MTDITRQLDKLEVSETTRSFKSACPGVKAIPIGDNKMTITRQQMIAFMNGEVYPEFCGCKELEPIIDAIIAELQKVDERTLPEIPDGHWLNLLPLHEGGFLAQLVFENSNGEDVINEFGEGKSPREAVLNAISKIPTDSSEER